MEHAVKRSLLKLVRLAKSDGRFKPFCGASSHRILWPCLYHSVSLRRLKLEKEVTVKRLGYQRFFLQLLLLAVPWNFSFAFCFSAEWFERLVSKKINASAGYSVPSTCEIYDEPRTCLVDRTDQIGKFSRFCWLCRFSCRIQFVCKDFWNTKTRIFRYFPSTFAQFHPLKKDLLESLSFAFRCILFFKRSRY